MCCTIKPEYGFLWTQAPFCYSNINMSSSQICAVYLQVDLLPWLRVLYIKSIIMRATCLVCVAPSGRRCLLIIKRVNEGPKHDMFSSSGCYYSRRVRLNNLLMWVTLFPSLILKHSKSCAWWENPWGILQCGEREADSSAGRQIWFQAEVKGLFKTTVSSLDSNSTTHSHSWAGWRELCPY